MNTSFGSKDLTRKPQKRISNRKKKGQGFFHNNHSYNLLNRSSNLQTHSIGYSEYVLQSPNTRSYNARLHSSRPNSGYLKHIHSQSIRREKEHSTMGCYEEYTLKRIRTTSDMIKQQLMSPEHAPVTTENTNIESDNTISLSKSKPFRLSGEPSKLSDANKEYSMLKLKRKAIKTTEEITRLQMKQRRKDELREKFKRDYISKQKPNETHNAKEISDLILKHISKLNNERIMDFLNSGDSRYGEAFNHICKQKSFEVSKALRDLSHQEKPEACEIVNAVIPDFSIKIEQLPINVIKELSLTFDELHKNIGDQCLLKENLYLFNASSDTQISDDLSVILQQICSDEINEKNSNSPDVNTKIQNLNNLDNRDVIQNAENCRNTVELIEILDSEEEILDSEQTDNIKTVVNHQISIIEEVVDSTETNCILPAKQSICLNADIVEIGSPSTIPCKEETESIIYSNHLLGPENYESPNSPQNLVSVSVNQDLLTDTSSSINLLSDNKNDSNEITKEVADSTYIPYLDLVKIEENPVEDVKPLIPTEIRDSNLQPKVGSVWVSRNIFDTSNSWNRLEQHEIDKSNEYCPENSLDKENVDEPSNCLTPASEQVLETMTVANENNPNILENNSLDQESNELNIGKGNEKNFECAPVSNKISSEIPKDIDSDARQNYVLHIPSDPNSSICTFQHSSSDVEALTNTTSILPPASKDSSEQTEINNDNNKSKDENMQEGNIKMPHTSKHMLDKSSIISTINKQPDVLTEPSNITNIDLVKTSKIIPASVINSTFENDFVSLIIKPFDKPKNLEDAINVMTVIDKQIEILTKLRQDVFIGLSEDLTESEFVPSKATKRKLEESAEFLENSAKKCTHTEVEKNNLNSEKSNTDNLLMEKNSVQENKATNKISSATEVQIKKISGQESTSNTKISSQKELQVEERPKHGNKSKPFESLHCVNAVILFCKVIFDKGECIIGTDNGKIQYHSIYGKKPLMTVTIGNGAISFLECVRINDWYYVCTGNTSELELKILKYKKRFIEQKVHLEDSIAVVRNEWGYFFIGGNRGYLTRYDWRKDRIQFEDRISSSSIKYLTATREGPRKILVILFEDTDGVAHIHVRDAMTALHIRTIIDMKNVRSMYLRYSSVYLATDEQISVYNCCDGNFVRKVSTQKPFSIIKSRGNLMVLGSADGIYGFNMRTNKYLGCLKEEVSASSIVIYEGMILCGTWSKKFELIDVPDQFKDILEYK